MCTDEESIMENVLLDCYDMPCYYNCPIITQYAICNMHNMTISFYYYYIVMIDAFYLLYNITNIKYNIILLWPINNK